MKRLIETTGEFELVDFTYRNQLVESIRPSVVTMTTFLQGRSALGQLRVLGEVNDEATDEEFERFWKDSEGTELAVASFLSAFPVEHPGPRPRAKKVDAKAQP